MSRDPRPKIDRMAKRSLALDVARLTTLRKHVDAHGVRATARQAGVHHTAIQRALKGQSVSEVTLKALAKIAPRVRTRDEFTGATGGLTAPRRQAQQLSWKLDQIRAARDAQMTGRFAKPVELSRVMMNDDAIAVAFNGRMAPHMAMGVRLKAEGSTRGEAVCRKAQASVFMPRSELLSLTSTLVHHDIAVGQIIQEPNEAGTQVDFRLKEWPLEYVEWNPTKQTLWTRAEGEIERIPIVHGNGSWVVFRKYATYPWTHATILAAALIWAAHVGNTASWMASADAHGRARMAGSLPEGVALQDEGGNLTPEASNFLSLMNELADGLVAAGVLPAGSEAKFLANPSGAWQIFDTLGISREKAAMRLYTGTDALLGSVGGAPGIDISTLFGVATTIIQGDMAAIVQGVNTGILEPWAAVNEGTSRYAPTLEYDYPDPDADANREQSRKAYERLHTTLEEMRGLGFVIDQDTVADLAKKFGVHPVPTLATSDTVVQIDLAPTDLAKVTKVIEARASRRMPPLGDERDQLFISELDAYAEAKNNPEPPPAAAPTSTPETPDANA